MAKAQAAMEFLMTYGWAALILLIVIATIAYFGFLDPARMLPETCIASSGFSCTEAAVVDASADNFTFALTNNMGFMVNITGITDDDGQDDDCMSPAIEACTGYACIPAKIPDGMTVDNDQKAILMVSCSGINAGRFKADVTLPFRSMESGLLHQAIVEIKGNAQ